MKKPSSGLGVGLWVASTLVAVYLLGAVGCYVDFRLGFPFYYRCPEAVQATLNFIYAPFFGPLAQAFPELFPLRS
jgi:hypothetical protein